MQKNLLKVKMNEFNEGMNERINNLEYNTSKSVIYKKIQ